MNFLHRFGLSDETVRFIEPYCIKEKGKLSFPFFSLEQSLSCSSEVLFINKTIKNADNGLLTIEQDAYAIKTQMIIFDNILNLLAYYNDSNRFLFENTVFVVVSIKPTFSDIQFLKNKFIYVKNYSLVFNQDLAGYCKAILITSYLSNIENISIHLNGDQLIVNLNDLTKNFLLDKFTFKRFKSLFKIPIKIVSTKPKGIFFNH